jgi:alkanesulfonate monooxygenase SsuD/methylene tetrahydromethanopterin reductase-like flavin-dependent oxidoreductase (luciferase family)
VRFLLEPEPRADLESLRACAQAVRAAGLDGLLLRRSPALAAPLVAASALAASVPELLLAVEVELGAIHPLRLAEQAAVVDLVSGGRLVLVARPAPTVERHYGEALDLLRSALTARPFRFEGERWRVPAELPENQHNREQRVRMTPAPAQVRLELWGAGEQAAEALARGLGYLAEQDAPALEALWTTGAAPALLGAPRARRETLVLDDPAALVQRLRAGRAAFGQDWAVVRGGAAEAHVLGTRVRPRIQLDRLTVGLEQYWDAHLDELLRGSA